MSAPRASEGVTTGGSSSVTPVVEESSLVKTRTRESSVSGDAVSATREMRESIRAAASGAVFEPRLRAARLASFRKRAASATSCGATTRPFERPRRYSCAASCAVDATLLTVAAKLLDVSPGETLRREATRGIALMRSILNRFLIAFVKLESGSRIWKRGVIQAG